MRILIVLGADAYHRAGGVLEVDGLVEAYYSFRDAGVDVVVAAPGGGSASEARTTSPSPALERFKSDRGTRDALNDLVDLASVCAGDFNGALFLGAQDHIADLLIIRLLATAKPVAVIAPVCAAVLSEAGSGLLIIGNNREAPKLAANALLGAIRGR